jgi:hypothetical protein
MSWNHRILAHKAREDWFFQIHEVYYEKNGIPYGYTKDGVSVGAESVEGIHWVLDRMRECANKPILSAENFPNEWSGDDKSF